MAKHRVLEPVTYVDGGAVISVKKGRVVDLTDEQALSLHGKVAPILEADSMFPGGSPIIPSHIVRAVPPVIAGDPVPAPAGATAPKRPAPPASTPKSDA